MIFLGNLEKVTETKYRVGLTHHMPFHPKHGFGKTAEELEQEGILVDSIPEEQKVEGKSAIRYVNPSTKEIYYEYEDILPTSEDLQQEINAKLLKDSASMQIEINKQRELNATLLIKMAELGGSTNA